MSYEFKFDFGVRGPEKVEILIREEYEKLDADDKDSYINGPWPDDDDEEDELNVATWRFIKLCLEENDRGDKGYPEIVEAFMDERFPDEKNNILQQIGDEDEKSFDQTQKYVDFIFSFKSDELDDEFDVYIFDYIYNDSFFYKCLIEECEKQENLLKTHKDIPLEEIEKSWHLVSIYTEFEEEVKALGLGYTYIKAYPGSERGPSLEVLIPCTFEQWLSIHDGNLAIEKDLLVQSGLKPHHIANEDGLRSRAIPLEALKNKDKEQR